MQWHHFWPHWKCHHVASSHVPIFSRCPAEQQWEQHVHPCSAVQKPLLCLWLALFHFSTNTQSTMKSGIRGNTDNIRGNYWLQSLCFLMATEQTRLTFMFYLHDCYQHTGLVVLFVPFGGLIWSPIFFCTPGVFLQLYRNPLAVCFGPYEISTVHP